MNPWVKATLIGIGIIVGGVVIISVVELMTFASVFSGAARDTFEFVRGTL